jgi:hypothetical protein
MHHYLQGSDILAADGPEISLPTPSGKTVQTTLPPVTLADGKVTVIPVVLQEKTEPVWQICFDLFTAVLGGYILWHVTKSKD